jgi:hypothetical protein
MALRQRDAAEHHRLKAVRNEGRTTPLGCECADLRCNATLTLTSSELASLRTRPGRFWIKPGHELVDVDRVVEQNERYVVVLIPALSQ